MSKRKNNAQPKTVKPWKHLVMPARRKAAEERQAAYDKLTIEQKIKRLDDGGFVAAKQRAKLLAKQSSNTK